MKLANAQTGKLIHTFVCGKKHENCPPGLDAEKSVESVAFCTSIPVLATATVKGFIEIWDVTNYSRRCQMSNPAGVSKVLWDFSEPYLLHVAGLDGSLTTWDGRTGQLQATRYGHRDQILDFDVSKGGAVIVTASEDTSLRVFDTKSTITNITVAQMGS